MCLERERVKADVSDYAAVNSKFYTPRRSDLLHQQHQQEPHQQSHFPPSPSPFSLEQINLPPCFLCLGHPQGGPSLAEIKRFDSQSFLTYPPLACFPLSPWPPVEPLYPMCLPLVHSPSVAILPLIPPSPFPAFPPVPPTPCLCFPPLIPRNM